MMLNLSLGIMAYNEEANIGRLLHALLSQRLTRAILKEIIVVASGSSDKTINIVRDFMNKDSRISLFIQPKRMGKASAVNLFYSDVVLLAQEKRVCQPFCAQPRSGRATSGPGPSELPPGRRNS